MSSNPPENWLGRGRLNGRKDLHSSAMNVRRERRVVQSGRRPHKNEGKRGEYETVRRVNSCSWKKLAEERYQLLKGGSA
jgi:hypothetical protein